MMVPRPRNVEPSNGTMQNLHGRITQLLQNTLKRGDSQVDMTMIYLFTGLFYGESSCNLF